jgi:glucose/arabinose dehydrogenase
MERRTLLKAGLTAPLAVALAEGGAPALAAPTATRTLATGLNFPWGAAFLPDGSALVSERNSGRVLRVLPTGGAAEVGRILGVFNNGGEGGLMGLALSPDFGRDRWVYMYQTTRTDNRVIRVKFVDGSLGARQVVLGGIPRAQTHNGGGLWFTGRPSGNPSLWVTTGDTRNSALAQNKRSLAGKILRLRPDGTAQRGNPFGNRVYSYGHRNPEGITMDPDGRMWSSELGENTWDELNQIRFGRNYGWPRVEGPDGPGGYTDPLTQWHPVNCSPSGIAILGGRAWIGALRGQSLWSVDIVGAGAGTRQRYFQGTFGRIRMVKRAPDNSLWIGTSNGGGGDVIVRITI